MTDAVLVESMLHPKREDINLTADDDDAGKAALRALTANPRMKHHLLHLRQELQRATGTSPATVGHPSQRRPVKRRRRRIAWLARLLRRPLPA